jgi:hypothetical protein
MAMKRYVFSSLLAVLLLAAWLSPQLVQAQQPGGARPLQPAVSPYLNLLRQGSSPANNFYNLVLPQIDNANSIYGLQQQLNGVTAQGTPGVIGGNIGPLTTGHPTMFLNTYRYFPGSKSTSGSGSGQTR